MFFHNKFKIQISKTLILNSINIIFVPDKTMIKQRRHITTMLWNSPSIEGLFCYDVLENGRQNACFYQKY